MGTALDARNTHHSDGSPPGSVSAPPGARSTVTEQRAALGALSSSGVAAMASTDVGAHKARTRSTRLQRLAGLLAVIATLLVLRDLLAPGMSLPSPSIPPGLTPYLMPLGLIVLLSAVMVVPLLGAGRSPHILYRPDELTMTFDDVRGSDCLLYTSPSPRD